MSKPRRRIGLLLLLTLFLSTSSVGAAPPQRATRKKNMKIGVEVAFGVPCGLMFKIKKEDITKYVDATSIRDIQVSPNWQFGAVWGYGVPFWGSFLAIGPELGLFWGTKRKLKISLRGGSSMSIEERHLSVPLALKLVTVRKEIVGLVLGYEIDCVLSSKCNISPSSKHSMSSEYKSKLEQQAEGIARFSTVGGSIFLGGRLELLAGYYIMGQLKFPVKDFLGTRGGDPDDNNDKSKQYLHVARCLGASCAELSLGINIMRWLF